MTTQAIGARILLRETFAVFRPLYVPLLLISSPGLILNFLNGIESLQSIVGVLDIIYSLSILPFLSGASIFYTYRSLSGNTVSVGEAFKQANRKLLQLILGWLLYILIFLTGLIALIIPGIYLPNRLIFLLYAIAIENCSATEGLSRSWELTKGRWWLIFRSSFLLSIVAFIPGVLVTLLAYPTGKAQLVSGIVGFLIGPFFAINFVLLYMRLSDRPKNV
jgi:membrane-anchored glycerophosphoryl diester phosphodiesterase (GDPDase)